MKFDLCSSFTRVVLRISLGKPRGFPGMIRTVTCCPCKTQSFFAPSIVHPKRPGLECDFYTVDTQAKAISRHFPHRIREPQQAP